MKNHCLPQTLANLAKRLKPRMAQLRETPPPARENEPATAPAPDSVRCSACIHATPATPGDPWSWHTCAADAPRATGWGMAERRCGQWEAAL